MTKYRRLVADLSFKLLEWRTQTANHFDNIISHFFNPNIRNKSDLQKQVALNCSASKTVYTDSRFQF